MKLNIKKFSKIHQFKSPIKILCPLLLVILLIFCGEKEETYVIKDERYYMEKLKIYTAQCARGTQINTKCLNKKIKKNIPSKYYVHVRSFKDDKGNIGWEFACIDTTKYGHEEDLDYFTPSIVLAKGSPKVARRWSNLIPAVRVCKSHEWFGHPSPKYLSVYSKYVAMLLPQNGLLVDPFAGSGTSLVACKRLNRKAIGIEIEEKFCRIIVERLSQCEMGLGALNMESSLTSANTPCMPLPQQVEAEL